MGDLPQYFKLVRWMLTSSLKCFKCAKIFKCQFTKQLLGYLHYSTFFVLLLNFLTYLAETIVLYSLILVLFLLTICVDAEKPIQGASIKICICTPQKYILEDMDVHRLKSNRNSYLLLLSKAVTEMYQQISSPERIVAWSLPQRCTMD